MLLFQHLKKTKQNKTTMKKPMWKKDIITVIEPLEYLNNFKFIQIFYSTQV